MSDLLLVATEGAVLRTRAEGGAVGRVEGLDGAHPTSLAADPNVAGRAWCATHGEGVFRSEDGGATWTASGLEGEKLMTVAGTPARRDLVWAGAEPSVVWRSEDGGATWARTSDLETLPSSSEWAFPPRPDTHHVRWIAPHPTDAGRLWAAIEAGALISTVDGGVTWNDRVEGGPHDTHELAIHPGAPDVLRSAAGDGYFESRDAGATWSSPMEGFEVGYLRSVAIDPGDSEVTVVSAAPHAHVAYGAGSAVGSVYRREAADPWERVLDGWPDPPSTIAPLLIPGRASGELWAADERGVHGSRDGGRSWRRVAGFETAPRYLRGLALIRG